MMSWGKKSLWKNEKFCIYKPCPRVKWRRRILIKQVTFHKKWSFPLRISSINLTKSTVFYGSGQVSWSHLLRKSLMKNFNFYAVHRGSLFRTQDFLYGILLKMNSQLTTNPTLSGIYEWTYAYDFIDVAFILFICKFLTTCTKNTEKTLC